MTHNPLSSIRNPHSAIRNRTAFSLTEILVVIGILVGLMAILTPMIVKARRQAARTRQASDLQTITVALDAYKADFGDYPRPFAPGAGFATLGYALVAPGPQNSMASPAPVYDSNSKHYEPGDVVKGGGSKSGPPADAYVCIAHSDPPAATSDKDNWTPCLWEDYFDGPGFRQRQQGQKFGPYLQADRFKLRGYALLDIWGNPILYFPARSGSANVNNPQSYMWDSRDKSLNPVTGAKPLYDYVDNICMLGGKLSNTTPDKAQMAPVLHLLGDYNPNNPAATTNGNGQIDPGESAVTTGPYILWSAGPDAEGDPNFSYGLIDSQGKPDPNGKTDDVTNFDIPVGFLKK